MSVHLLSAYSDFIEKKSTQDVSSGFDPIDVRLNANLFDFQRAIVEWALRKGRAAVFADTGLGKTLTQLSWADAVVQHTGGRVLIVAPLCVAQQTVDEGAHFGIAAQYCRNASQIAGSIVVTNYEMLGHFDVSAFVGVVLDESSILKSEDSKTRAAVTAMFAETPYRLSCTATPSPNDYMELGNQAEFLGVMKASEMLAMFFTHDGGDTSKWRLKGHGTTRFWEWLATWSVYIRSPEDLGFDGSRYVLPPMSIIEHEVTVPYFKPGAMEPTERAVTMTERRQAKKQSVRERCELVAELVNDSVEEWVVWCNLNEESTLLASLIPDAVEVYGSLKPSEKERRLLSFSQREARVIVSKGSICGFGLNWQFCRNVAFVGLDDSFEKYYQAVRRCYRFGQKREVNVHLVYASAEGAVRENLERKQAQADWMAEQMVRRMRTFTQREVVATRIEKTDYQPATRIALPAWI